MKIGIIAPLYDPWNLGGAERYAKSLAEWLANEHQVFVITTRGPKPRKKNDSKIQIFEINPSRISTLHEMISDSNTNSLKKGIWHFQNIWNASAYSQIKKILTHQKPDLVHSNGIKGISVSSFSAIHSLKIPHVHTMHDYELISPWVILYRNGKLISRLNIFDKLYSSYLKKMSFSIDAVISPSKFLMTHHERLGYFEKSKKIIIPNGTNLEENPKVKKGKCQDFLYIGQVMESKGIQVAISAVKKLSNNEIKFHIIGTGPFFDSLKKIVGKEKNIIFHGYVDDDKLDSIFEKSSYAIVPSLWYENFPLVINQLMNKGLPVIASNIGGIPEIVKNEFNGFLFEPGNIESLVMILQKISSDEKLLEKLSNNAILSAKKFPIENQFKSIFQVYNEVLSTNQ